MDKKQHSRKIDLSSLNLTKKEKEQIWKMPTSDQGIMFGFIKQGLSMKEAEKALLDSLEMI